MQDLNIVLAVADALVLLLGLATPAMFLICSLQAAPLGRLYTTIRRQPAKRDTHESANHAFQP